MTFARVETCRGIGRIAIRHTGDDIPNMSGYCMTNDGRKINLHPAGTVLVHLIRPGRRYVPPVHQALVYLGLGDREGAFDALEQAVDERDVRLTFLAIEPRWAPLVNAPEFERVRARVGLPRVVANDA